MAKDTWMLAERRGGGGGGGEERDEPEL